MWLWNSYLRYVLHTCVEFKGTVKVVTLIDFLYLLMSPICVQNFLQGIRCSCLTDMFKYLKTLKFGINIIIGQTLLPADEKLLRKLMITKHTNGESYVKVWVPEFEYFRVMVGYFI